MKHLKFAKEYAPDLVEEVEGVAEGAKIEFEKVFLLNCYDEVSSYTPDIVNLWVVQVLGATGMATVDKVTYIGQGWDMDGWYIPVILQIAREGNEPEVLMLTHPGVIGGAAVNSAEARSCLE